MDSNQNIHLFVTILLRILDSKIKFVRTKQQPLLPNQSLMQPSKFKTTFIKFIETFKVKCDVNEILAKRNRSYGYPNQDHKKDKHRSDRILKSVISSLHEIERILLDLRQNKASHSQYAQYPQYPQYPKIQSRSDVVLKSYNNNNNDNIDYQQSRNNTPSTPSISPISSSTTPSIDDTRSESSMDHNPNPYSIYVPLNANYTLKYQFLSFQPLKIKKIMIISNPNIKL